MSKTVLVRGARQLVTLRGPSGPRRGRALRELAIIPDGALLIQDGVIREVGASRRVEMLAEARDALEIDVTGKAVVPAFVDCYTHVVSGLPIRSDWDDEPSASRSADVDRPSWGKASAVQAFRNTTRQRMEMETRRRLRQFVRKGTLTLEARTGLGLDEPTELRMLRVIAALDDRPLRLVPVFYGGRAVPPEYEDRAGDYLLWLADHMLPLIRQRALARIVAVCCGADGFNEQQALDYLKRADDLGFGLKVQAGLNGGSTAVKLAYEHNVISVDGIAGCSRDEAACLGACPSIVTLLPGRSYQQGMADFPDARTLIDQGAAVAIATGYDPDLCPTTSMPMTMSLAVTQMRMAPTEALSAATINAAHALGAARMAGSLEPGKSADLLILGSGDYRDIAYYFGMDMLAMAVRGGEVLYPRVESF